MTTHDDLAALLDKRSWSGRPWAVRGVILAAAADARRRVRMRNVLYLFTLAIAVFAIACGGGSAAAPDSAAVSEGAVDSPDDADDTGAALGANGGAAPTGAFQALQDCLAERGLSPTNDGDGPFQLDEDVAAAREECATEAGLDPDVAAFGGFGGTQIVTCLGEQGVPIEGIESLADLGLGGGGQRGFGGNGGQGSDPAAAAAALAERLGLDPEDPLLAAAAACFGQFDGGVGGRGGGPNAGVGSVVDRVASCLEEQGFEVERDDVDPSDAADSQFTGLGVIADQLGLDLTDPDTLSAVQSCLRRP